MKNVPHDWEYGLAQTYIVNYMRAWQSRYSDMTSNDIRTAFNSPLLRDVIDYLIAAELIHVKRRLFHFATYHCQEYSFR